ncbi:hypothetical protein PM082_008802 [Marasmius tenuissimus]|nr:hypothetical protein PM082_008802 [Marasmius tenuissimus]
MTVPWLLKVDINSLLLGPVALEDPTPLFLTIEWSVYERTVTLSRPKGCLNLSVFRFNAQNVAHGVLTSHYSPDISNESKS